MSTIRSIIESGNGGEALKNCIDAHEQNLNVHTSYLQDSNKQLEKEISGREKAEEEKARLAAAVESTDEVVIIISQQGKIEYVNPAFERLAGYTKEEVLGRSPVILGSNRHERSLYMSLLNTMLLGKIWTGRIICNKKKGEHVHFEGTISPVMDRTGKVISYVSVFQDITERMRLEHIAEAASTMNSLGYAFSGLRHELVNPLNSIKVSLGVLQEKHDPSIKIYIERAQAEVARMEYLLKSLKNFNMYEELEIRKLDLAAFLGDFVSMIRSDFSGKGINTLLTAETAVLAMCDPRALKQILLNLVANAADALAGIAAPEIRFGLFKLGRTSMIRVEDNGSGIGKRQMKNLFKPFNTTKKQGTGLGLVIVKKIVTKMGGKVELSSSKGHGTTVDIFLPAARS